MKNIVQKIFRKLPESAAYVIPCVILFCLMIYAIILRMNAETTGNTIGQVTGNQAGKLVGSFEALLDYEKAYAEGKEQGLSAEDTTAKIANQITSTGNLEVLVASVKLSNIHTIGDDDYAALYLGKGEAIFTVDLSQAQIDEKNDVVYIKLPEPQMELVVRQEEIDQVAEYQREFFNGSAEDGFDAYLNTMSKMMSETEATLANYDVLKNTAMEAAKKQITQLVSSITIENKKVIVGFFVEYGGDN